MNIKIAFFYKILLYFTYKNYRKHISIIIYKWFIHFELVYLVTALVPSLTACLANSPGNKSLTEV